MRSAASCRSNCRGPSWCRCRRRGTAPTSARRARRSPPSRHFLMLRDEDVDDLIEHAPCGYLSLTPDGGIVRVNATFLEWTGYDREAVLGRRFVDLLSAGGRIFHETHFQPLLRMQGFVREVALEIVRQDGGRLSTLVNAAQRDYEDAGVITRITVFDATDRRRYERELLLAKKAAED